MLSRTLGEGEVFRHHTFSQHIDSLKRYITGLGELLRKGDEEVQNTRSKRFFGVLGTVPMSFAWNSPLGETPAKFFEMPTLNAEAGLACMVLASGIQALAYWHLERFLEATASNPELVASSPPGKDTDNLQKATSLLRRAIHVTASRSRS